MPPVHEDKKYCIRNNCPFPGYDTVESFSSGVRDRALIMLPYQSIEYTRILESNGYERVTISDTETFERG